MVQFYNKKLSFFKVTIKNRNAIEILQIHKKEEQNHFY